MPQAIALDERLGEKGIDVVITLELDRAEIIDRISGRRSCRHGHVYHVTAHPPLKEGVCDKDGEPLFRRHDDEPEVVAARLDTYVSETEPLLSYYEERELLERVDGSGSPSEVYRRVEAVFLGLEREV
jgi:adenylate kinase